MEHLLSPPQLKNKIQQLRTSVEIAEKIHSKEKAKYWQMGDTCVRLRGRLDEVEGGAIKIKLVRKYTYSEKQQ